MKWIFKMIASEKRLPGKICAVKRAVKVNLDLLDPEFLGKTREKYFKIFKYESQHLKKRCPLWNHSGRQSECPMGSLVIHIPYNSAVPRICMATALKGSWEFENALRYQVVFLHGDLSWLSRLVPNSGVNFTDANWPDQPSGGKIS